MAASEVVIKVVGDSKSFDKTMDGVDSRAASTAKQMASAGRALSAGLTLPIVAADTDTPA